MKKNILMLSCLLSLVLVNFTFYSFETGNDSGVIIPKISVKKVNVSDDYYSFSYSIFPSDSNEVVSCSLSSSNESLDASTYYYAEIDNTIKTCYVEVLKPCGYQCVLHLNSSIASCSVSLDYMKKVNGISSHLYNHENVSLDMYNSLTYGVGSVDSNLGKVVGLVTNESYTFNQDFIDDCHDIMQDEIYFNYLGDYSSLETFGFTNAHASYYFSHSLIYYNFLGFFGGTYVDDYRDQHEFSFNHLSDQGMIDSLCDIFDGTHPVFDYAFDCDGTHYVNSVGMLISSSYF
ncbi:MAG: hypothetical protein WCS51_02475 [Bacilli bacterium]